ncbi:hypothetical protein [Fibrobacter sp. UWB12]|uniref:hypothetical protein n=1 Tax=Fibrobacter sp. UWB12 TaxID=1896203 RepID=UPI00091A77DD|nr:hypothetical protein [Fibrobacter sp. UWB12]SHK38893.1 hypothetical protein SAMN05720759_102241 [Fibrobacter sp. UWB12]
MKNFCKNLWILGILCTLWACFFTSCSESVDADGHPILPPDSSRPIVHKLYPNDLAKNDSAAVNLARGIALVVHPGASYSLSFDIDTTQPAPELQLFRTYDLKNSKNQVGTVRVRTLSPTIVGNRYVYSFVCEENKMSIWFTTLGVDGEYYKGNVENISFQGLGSYSDHFSINLIVVGSMVNTLDGKNIDELSSFMLKLFREKYYGVTIDTLYVRYAQNHPTLGAYYPADQPWVAGVSSEDLFVSELTGWPEEGLSNALNIVLVHSIGENDVMGFSRLFSGVLGAGNESSVVIGEYVKKSSNEFELLSSDIIAMTAVHETGHFFGLRHTSTTRRDLNQTMTLSDGTPVVVGDFSNIEDGLTDTPFCEYILKSGLYKQGESPEGHARERGTYLAKSSIYSCPDLDNIMFPVTVDELDDASFTKQQMEIIRSSLMIFPH